jgi:hypothetical protein
MSLVQFYVTLVKSGKISIEEVPAKFRDAVREELEK